jgi:hypothetical protein
MRKLAALAAAFGMAVLATPAAACLPPPPPNFIGWLNDPSVAMFVGRVDRVEILPPENSGGLIIIPGRAHIVGLEIIQGTPTVDTAEAGGALEVRYPTPPVGGPPCLNYLEHKAGDLVIVVQLTPAHSHPLVYSRHWATLPQLTPYFEKHL